MSSNKKKKEIDSASTIEKLQQEIEQELWDDLTKDVSLTPHLTEEIKKLVKERAREELQKELKDRYAKLKPEKVEIPPEVKKEEERMYSRLSLNIRIQHVILMISTLILIITGLPIKFHDSAWAQFFFSAIGGLQTGRILHRVGAVGLIGIALYHLMFLAFSREGREIFRELLPRPKDLKDLWVMLNYLLGRKREKAKFGKFTYVEKFDYWAVYWGMVVMVGSGLILWFLGIALSIFPKYVADIAREAHSDEALLATLAIIIWHFYNAHLNPEKFPMNRSWLNGKVSEKEMEKEHFLEWVEIQKKEEMVTDKPVEGTVAEQKE
ncbi:MAG TPA: cytochrome b/b6 domain-containing protein [Terriglobales bacterium]|nr:cytochrome b/b6 domain-containing protein [Terriglobales bacterium]